MIPLNLYKIYLYYINHHVEQDKVNKYLNFLNKADENVKIKEHEWKCLASMIENLIQNGAAISNFEGFYFGYTIPQISKEFDLLRLSSDLVINIELKTKVTDKILKQLVRNRYYLSHLSRRIVSFTYIQSKNSFYQYQDDSLIFVSPKEVIATLNNQKDLLDNDINQYFKVSNFLVSPLNNTERFFRGEYFLNLKQEEIELGIEKDAELTQIKNYIIKAGAGTGKTLLVYHIALSFCRRYNVCVFHCGYLCEGHELINRREARMNILPIKNFLTIDLEKYDLIIIDEAHRLYASQVNKIIEMIKNGKHGFILSLDPMQALATTEIQTDVYNELKRLVDITEYTLSEKIRTNKQLASFIHNMTELTKRNPNMKYDDVEILYCNNYSEAINIIEYYKYSGYIFINYTPSTCVGSIYDKFNQYQSAHQVIGQEFEKVMVMIGNELIYNDKKQLVSYGKAPNPKHLFHRMLYQQITRVRDKLCILVVGNKNVFDNLLNIVTGEE